MRFFYLFILTFLFFSCDDPKKYDMITGDWKCSSWVVSSTGTENCNDNVQFTFNENKTYSSKIGSTTESGEYEILNDQLICYPKDKMKIGVHLDKLTQDTLQFTMSRSGQKEVRTLVKN